MKLYKLCGRATGYTYNFRVYEAKDSQLEPLICTAYTGSSGKIVWTPVTPLFNLCVHNCYTSLTLFWPPLSPSNFCLWYSVAKPQGHPIKVGCHKAEWRGINNYNQFMGGVDYKDKCYTPTQPPKKAIYLFHLAL